MRCLTLLEYTLVYVELLYKQNIPMKEKQRATALALMGCWELYRCTYIHTWSVTLGCQQFFFRCYCTVAVYFKSYGRWDNCRKKVNCALILIIATAKHLLLSPVTFVPLLYIHAASDDPCWHILLCSTKFSQNNYFPMRLKVPSLSTLTLLWHLFFST